MKKEIKIQRTKQEDILSFETLYSEFVNSRKIKNVRQVTLRSYYANSMDFRKWLKAKGIEDMKQITKKTIKEYMMHLQDTQGNQSTINSYLRAVKAFLYYAMEDEQGYIPMFRFSLPKEDVKVGLTYTDDEIRLLIKKPDFSHCKDGEYKMWVVVNYMLDTGNRLATVRNIKVEDVYLLKGIIMLRHTKNREAGFIPISTSLQKILTKYIRDFNLTDSDFLFPTVTGCMYGSEALYHEIARYNKNRGVMTTATHAFRRTFASNYVRNGGDAFNLKKLLGHKTLKMTERYIKIYDEDYLKGFETFSLIGEFNKSYTIKRIKKTPTK